MKKLLFFFVISILQLTLFAQGNLDVNFGNNGLVTTQIGNSESKSFDVKLQSDGKIVIAGYTYSNITGYDFVCARYNVNGQLDNTFGDNGITTIDLQGGSDDKAKSLEIDLDNKIVIVGSSDNGSLQGGALVRLNEDGSLDSSFGNNGITIHEQQTSTWDYAIEYNVVRIHYASGKIVTGGTKYFTGQRSFIIISKFNDNGTMDSSFGDDGNAEYTGIPINEVNGVEWVLEDLKLKPNGKITAVGWINEVGDGNLLDGDHYMCRFNSNGTIDNTFDTDGQDYSVVTTGDDESHSMYLNPDDSFLVVGSTKWTANDHRTYFAKVNSSGSSFSNYGWIQLSESSKDIGYSLDKDSEGRYLIGGSTSIDDISSFFLVRINSDNSIDDSFGENGLITTSFGANTFSKAFGMVIQPDNKIILVGYSDNKIALARYNGGSLSTLEQTVDEIKIHPNPTSSYFQIDNKDTINKIEFFSFDNKLVKTIFNPDSKIDVSDISSGVYFLRVYTSTGVVNEKLIIK